MFALLEITCAFFATYLFTWCWNDEINVRYMYQTKSCIKKNGQKDGPKLELKACLIKTIY